MLIQKGYPVPVELDATILDKMEKSEIWPVYDGVGYEATDIYCQECGKFLGHYTKEQMHKAHDIAMSGTCYIPIEFHNNCPANYSQYVKIKGIFKPKNKETLRDEALPFVGKPLKFMAMWIIEDGQYEGQWAFQPLTMDDKRVPMGWVPQEDIEEYHRFT